jgi:hypothetical protein
MASQSLVLLVAPLLLVLTIVAFFVVLGDYLFQPMLGPVRQPAVGIVAADCFQLTCLVCRPSSSPL